MHFTGRSAIGTVVFVGSFIALNQGSDGIRPLAVAAVAASRATSGQPASDHGEVWVTAQNTDELKILLGMGDVETVALPARTAPHTISFSPDGSHAYVSNIGNGALIVVRADARQIVAATLVADGGGQPEPVPASRAVAVRPSNLAAASVFQSFLERMWRSSPTFNRQCRRLVAAQHLKVVLHLEGLQRRPSFYARTVLGRQDGVLVAADVFLPPTPDAVEFIAHEVEHVLEQLDGVDLEAQVGSGNVWRRADGSFETRRATEAGRRVAREVTLRTGGSDRQR